MRGYFSINRKLLTSQKWLEEPFTRGQAWVDLIGLATHKNSFIRVRGIKVMLKRGQVGWSEIKLAERWHWSRGKVRRFVKELILDKQIIRQTVQQPCFSPSVEREDERGDNKQIPGKKTNILGPKTVQQTVQQVVQQNYRVTTVLTIINYDIYQSRSTTHGTTSSTADGQQTDNRRYPNNNGNNDNNDNKGKGARKARVPQWVSDKKKKSERNAKRAKAMADAARKHSARRGVKKV